MVNKPSTGLPQVRACKVIQYLGAWTEVLPLTSHVITWVLQILFHSSRLGFERFSIECHETKTNVIARANHEGQRQCSEPIKTRSNYM